MSNKLILYNLDLSPPVRAVKTVARLLGLELEIRDVNLFDRDHLKEDYMALNPEHTVPTLVDGDFVIWDSHAICAYLVDKYAKNDSLYPKDLQLRAKCNQRLIFDAASLFVRLRDCSIYLIFQGGKEIPKDNVDSMYAAYDILEKFLATDPYLVGKTLTIADICTVLTVRPMDVYAPVPAEKYPKIVAWMKRVTEAIPFFDEINSHEYTENYRQIIKEALKKNNQK